jgi:NAD(P)-dependent dehydrogenase (short-subunit alcohol dehydrogenase family)
MNNPQSNNPPVILITGATRGIGLAAARLLLDRGATVIIGSRDESRANEAANKLGGRAEPLQIDITHRESLHRAAEEIAGHHGRLDVLVNNGAVLLDHYATITDLDPDTLRETLETNLIGTFQATLAMLPLLRKSAAPRVINVSSGAGQLDGEPQAWAPAYSISKTALNMLTQQFAVGLPDLVVNSMCPGWCRTEMGGPEAPLSPEQGADTLVWLALDAPPDLRASFVKERKVIPW